MRRKPGSEVLFSRRNVVYIIVFRCNINLMCRVLVFYFSKGSLHYFTVSIVNNIPGRTFLLFTFFTQHFCRLSMSKLSNDNHDDVLFV